MNIADLYELFLQHPQITTDSRNCPEKSIFFALKGDNFNGNEYAEKAIQQGCSYAIVDEEKFANNSNIILVDDSLKTLQKLANYHRSKFKIPFIGITGTNGKTTTKELTTAILSKEYKVLSTKGNLNNHIGVPLTLLQLTKEHEIAVIEMGASHVGEIKMLSEIADPTFGLITNLGEAHLEGFGSFENIIKTKCELYEYIRNRKDGKIFLDHNNQILKDLAEGITSIEYGTDENLFVRGKLIEVDDPYLNFEWIFSQNPHIIHSKLIGNYNLSNALAAISIGKYFGVKSSLVCEALVQYEPTNNRSQLIKTTKNHLVIDAYNANPTSMLAALSNFSQMPVHHKALILGDMRELGINTLTEHQKITDYVKDKHFEKVFLIGENFCKTNNSYQCFKNLSEFKEFLSKNNPLEDNYILIKGSRGIELEKCIELL